TPPAAGTERAGLPAPPGARPAGCRCAAKPASAPRSQHRPSACRAAWRACTQSSCARRARTAPPARAAPPPKARAESSRGPALLRGRAPVDARDHAIDVRLFEHDVGYREATEQALRERGRGTFPLVAHDDAVPLAFDDH